MWLDGDSAVRAAASRCQARIVGGAELTEANTPPNGSVALSIGRSLASLQPMLLQSSLQRLDWVLVHVQNSPRDESVGDFGLRGDSDAGLAGHLTAGWPRLPVFVAGDALSLLVLTMRAFRLATALRLPVIVLSSDVAWGERQNIGDDLTDIHADYFSPRRETRVHVGDAAAGRSAEATGASATVNEKSTPTSRGYDEWARVLHDHERELEVVDADLYPESDMLLISLGSVVPAAWEATRRLWSASRCVSHLTLYGLWPVPVRVIRRAITRRTMRVFVAENNGGLYVEEIRRHAGETVVETISSAVGEPLSAERIIQAISLSPCG